MEYSIYELAWFFLFYSLAGWCAGVAVAALRKHAFVNTGFLNLPLCPIYGVAAVLFTVFLSELRENLLFLFLGGAVLAAGLVYFTGFLLERIFHRKWWDYSRCRFQFEGYITLPLLAVWGLLAVLCVGVLDPFLAGLLDLVPLGTQQTVLVIALLLMAADLILSLVSVLQLRFRLRRLQTLRKDFRNISNQFGSAITGRVQRRVMRAYPNLKSGELLEEREKAPAVFAPGWGFHKMVWLFVIASFLGDVIETIFCRFSMGYWMSRSGVVWGPFSIVWGLGAVLLTAVLYKFKDRSDCYLFLAGTVLGGVYEYVCSVFLELAFGTIFWDYSHLPFNLGGRVNLLYCFFWGIAALVWIKGIYPRLSGLIERIPVRIGKIGTWVLVVFMAVNLLVTAMAMGRYTQRLSGETGEPNVVTEFLDDHFPNERMERLYPSAKQVD